MRIAASFLLIFLTGCGGTAPTGQPTPASPSPSATAEPTSTPTSAPTATGDAIEVEAEDVRFQPATITVDAGSTVAIELKNRDEGISHNLSVYTDDSVAEDIFIGERITGKDEIVYTIVVPEEPGDYFFRCDVHPDSMTGTLEVA